MELSRWYVEPLQNLGQDELDELASMRPITVECVKDIMQRRIHVVHWDTEEKPWDYAPEAYQRFPRLKPQVNIG
jgi:hypothetical protein